MGDSLLHCRDGTEGKGRKRKGQQRQVFSTNTSILHQNQHQLSLSSGRKSIALMHINALGAPSVLRASRTWCISPTTGTHPPTFPPCPYHQACASRHKRWRSGLLHKTFREDAVLQLQQRAASNTARDSKGYSSLATAAKVSEMSVKILSPLHRELNGRKS